MNAIIYRDGFYSGMKLLQRCEECNLCNEHRTAFFGSVWLSIESAPRDGSNFLAVIVDPDDGERMVRMVGWHKTSHVPMYGFCLVDQGVENSDLCTPICWTPMPPPPTDSDFKEQG